MIRFREYRKQAGLTQQELADKIGISKSYISEIERELRYPSIPVLVHISVILNTCINRLLGIDCDHNNWKDVTFL